MISRNSLIKLMLRSGVREIRAEYLADAVLAHIETDDDQLILGAGHDQTDIHKVYSIQRVGGATGAFARSPDAEIHIARRFKGKP